MKIILDSILELISSLFKGLAELFERDHEHNSEFQQHSEKYLSRRNKGWCVDGKRFTTLDVTRRNILVVAGSGMGKTQTMILPTILNAESSMVINDNSSELSMVIPYLISKGVATKVMNLTRKGEVYINPLDGCKGDVAAMRKVAKSITGKPGNGNDFFNTYAEDCISIFIQHVLEAEPKIYANLGNVYRLLIEYQADKEVVERYMAEKASPDVWRKFLALSQNSDKTLKSIVASAISKLSWLGENETLCDITAITNVSFEQFRTSQTALFIQSPASDSAFYAKMVSLLFQSFYRFAFSYLPNKEEELDIMMVQDEFSSLIEGLPDYSQIISNSRKFLIPQAIILQDESQLSPYGDLKDTILGNCYLKCYFGGQNKKSLELERLLGSYSYTDDKTGHKKRRPLMYASEIQQLQDEILVLVSGDKPIKTKVIPAYKQRRLKRYLQIEAEETASAPLTYSIEYIDLDPYREQIEAESEGHDNV